jgi:hypothetical protein
VAFLQRHKEKKTNKHSNDKYYIIRGT